jgi:hypothetical protein
MVTREPDVIVSISGDPKSESEAVQEGRRRYQTEEISLASKTTLPHSVTMAEVHSFTVKIEADPLRETRHRWTVREGIQIHLRSPHSYATRREAEAAADKALSKLVDRRSRDG